MIIILYYNCSQVNISIRSNLLFNVCTVLYRIRWTAVHFQKSYILFFTSPDVGARELFFEAIGAIESQSE